VPVLGAALAPLTLIDGSAVFTALNAETPWIITRP
jgi:hypothetical protein